MLPIFDVSLTSKLISTKFTKARQDTGQIEVYLLKLYEYEDELSESVDQFDNFTIQRVYMGRSHIYGHFKLTIS